MSVFADNIFSLQAGEDFINLTPAITGISFTDRQEFARIELIKEDDDENYPANFPTNFQGDLNITGLLYNSVGDDFVSASRSADFIRFNKELGFAYPICRISLQDRNVINSNGVLQVAGNSLGNRADGLTTWRYGRRLPTQFNANRASSGEDWGRPATGAWIAILVIKRGSMSALQVRYTISSTQYSLNADVESNAVVPQLKIGQLKNGNNLPAVAAGTWRLNATGSTSGSEVYVFVLE